MTGTPPQDDVAAHDVLRVNTVLDRLLPSVADVDNDVASLASAMRYAVLGGGKRLRPRLVYAAGRAAGADLDVLDRPAAAVELIHAFSLIHDDLPALDDDCLRRGRPTVHVRYDEATAVLAGDALLALAFEVLAGSFADAARATRWVCLLARATGAFGMIGGQMIDLAGESRRLELSALERLHRLKAGALIYAAVMCGAVAGRLGEAEQRTLGNFGEEIGLAFQIQDDVLDATAPTRTLGKRQGADERRGKSTYVTLLGVQAAATQATKHLQLALRHLAPLEERGKALAALAEQMVERTF